MSFSTASARPGARLAAPVFAFAFGLVLAGCGATDDTYFEDLRPGAIWWRHQVGLCSAIRAVDADRFIMQESGCETGRRPLRRVARAEKADHEALRTRIAALPRMMQTAAACNGNLHTFGVREMAGVSETSVCGMTAAGSTGGAGGTGGTGSTTGDPGGLEEPFLSVAKALKDLR